MSKKVIIDVSHHNVVEYFDRREINGVMIRATYGKKNKDTCLKKHVELAVKAGIPYGFYHYSYALNKKDAELESKNFLSAIADYSPLLPIAIDMEDADGYKKKNSVNSKEQWCDIAFTLCDLCERAGYYTLLYANEWDMNNMLDDSRLYRFGKWVANWKKFPVIKSGKLSMWQLSAYQHYTGISGNVDVNAPFVNFEEKIKENGLNGYDFGKRNDFLKIGDVVRVETPYDYNGVKNDLWVLSTQFVVVKIDKERVVIGKTPNEITGAWHISDLKKVR